MVDSLRAALRLLPAVRPSIGGTNIGLCSRVSKARIHSASEQSALLALNVHPQIINSDKALPGGAGIVRFARAVLAYVGAGLSAVTANQFAGPSLLQAKELGSSAGGNHTIGATEAGGMWHRPSASRHVVQEDVIRSTNFAHCPLPHIVPKPQADACFAVAHSYYSNNSWGPLDVRFSLDAKVDSQWQWSPSTNRDYLSKLGGLDEGLSSRFSKPTGLQALAADSRIPLKSNAGPMGSVSDYSAAAELELEWQFIVDPKCRAGLETPISEGRICEEDEEIIFEEVLGSNSKQDGPEKIKLVNTSEVGSSEDGPEKIRLVNKSEVGSSELRTIIRKELTGKHGEEKMMKNNKEIMVPSECREGEHQIITSNQGVVFQETIQHDGMDYVSSVERNLLGRTTYKENLIPLDALKAAERVENCELPSAAVHTLSRIHLTRFDIIEKTGDNIRSLDKDLLTAILRRNEPTRLENSGLPSSAILPGNSRPTAEAHVHFQTISQPLTIPSTLGRPYIRRGSCSPSADTRNTSWNGGGAKSMTTDRGAGLLGEALCHSQTRAREAEKKVQQAYEEQERLVRFCFREASRSLTYQHWVTSLQVENMWLRKFAPNESVSWLHCSFVHPFSAMGHMSRRSWKDLEKDAQRQMEQSVSSMHEKDAVERGESNSNDIVMGCTLGIAFALGLSLAGAGLVIGWSMGWILLAYSVSV